MCLLDILSARFVVIIVVVVVEREKMGPQNKCTFFWPDGF
jgi:hypothetical protein